MQKLIHQLFFFVFIVSNSLAQHADKRIHKSIDSLLASKYALKDPGVTVLIAKEGRIIYKKGFGSANLELKVPMSADMLFNIGSITKQFTAVAILQLIEKGKLSLKDTIQQHIPGFPAKGYKITVENLLTHTSGLKDYLQIDYQQPYMERRDFTPTELIEYFKNQRLEFEPGTKYKYSNSGYFLLGYIIEMVSGKTYEKYLKENIFDVLELNNTYYDNPNKIFPNRTNGYKKSASYEKADYWGATIPYAAGALISNVEDLYKWHSGLYKYKLLNRQTLDQAFTPFSLKNNIKVNYGYGWIINDLNGLLSISHGGAITGYRTNEIYYPQKDIFITILGNCDCTPIDELSASISAIVLGKPLQQGIKLNDGMIDKYIGVYALTTDLKRKMKIAKENGMLVAYSPENNRHQLLFQSERKFVFKDISDAKCEFIIEDSQVLKFNVSQNGIFEWKKIE